MNDVSESTKMGWVGNMEMEDGSWNIERLEMS